MSGFVSIESGKEHPALSSALGDMLLAWTKAEEAQIGAMSAMLQISPNEGVRIYQKLPNFRSRTQMLYLLIELNPQYEHVRKAIEAISSLSKTRNRYVHGGFIRNLDDQSDIRSINYDKPSGHKERSKPTKPADITNHANAVRRRADELEKGLLSVQSYKDWLGA